MSSKNHTQGPVDNNANLKVGTRIDGVFTKKLDFGMVVDFKVDGKPCTGVLAIEKFPSGDEAMRAKMFEVAAVGMPAPGLIIISVRPPKEGKRFSRVRLSARADEDTKRPSAAKRRRRKNAAARQQTPATASGASTIPVREVDGKIASLPLPTGPAREVQMHEVDTFKPRTSCMVPGLIAPVRYRPVADTALIESIEKVPPFVDQVDKARRLVVEARTPARSCGLADLGRTMALARLSGNAEASALLASLESQLAKLDAVDAEATQAKSSINADMVGKAITLYSVREQKRQLDADNAVLKQESARYAGLCGKVKRADASVAADLQTQATAMKTALDAKRASLKEAFAANKKADDDADLDLLFSISTTGDYKVAMEEAVENAGKLVKAIEKRFSLIGELHGLIGAYEKSLNSRA